MKKTELENQIAQTLGRFEHENTGRAPATVRAYLLEDLILVRLTDVLTPAERTLGCEEEGRRLVKQVRAEILELARPTLEEYILKVTGCPVRSLHSDLSTRTGERIILFSLARRFDPGDVHANT
ncbi:MAG: DUF2294 domain-containing protein [Chloroflexi bacterium]|nr:DUF2294 domain-containing protein [Chloroflexota bacterium]